MPNNPIATTFRAAANNRPALIINRPAAAGSVPENPASDLPEVEKTQVERKVSPEVLKSERKKAGVIRPGSKVDASKKALRNGNGALLHSHLDPRALANLEEAESVLRDLIGVEPSRTILVRRAIAVYVKYLTNNIASDADKALAELRAILRTR